MCLVDILYKHGNGAKAIEQGTRVDNEKVKESLLL
jgi:hypothetical protein